jgi:hypothetical protein
MADESSGLAEGNVEPLKATDGDGSSSGDPIAAVIAGGRAPARSRRHCARGRLAHRFRVELFALALRRHAHGRHEHDRIADDPVGHGTHDAGGYAVAGAGVRIRLRHVDRDDGRYDDAIGGPDVSYVCPRGPADRAARQVAQGYRLVRGWLFLVWVAFALFATLVQWGFERSALLDFTMASTDNVLCGLVFVAAGLYQWTRLNDLCLAQCQRPFEFVMCHGGFRRDVPGCVVLGLRHGAYCVGCCWALMALLLVGGVMNVLWIALLALLAFLERVTSMGRVIARFAGIVLVVGGAWLFAMGTS